MTHNRTQFSSWFVNDNDRAKTVIKNQLRMMKHDLLGFINDFDELETYVEVGLLCRSIAKKYLDYLQLLDQKRTEFTSHGLERELSWPEHFERIFLLEEKLGTSLDEEEQKQFLLQIIFLYQCVPSTGHSVSKPVHPHLIQLQQLFSLRPFNLWLEGLVDLLNKNELEHRGFLAVFYDWDVKHQQMALDYFANPEFAELVNAMFFYKIHPEKLFVEIIHPEKLVSIQMRVGALHYYIELMRQKLYEIALQNGLIRGVDYFLHEELPPGITIHTNEAFRAVIQVAVKRMKLNSNPTLVQRELVDYLSDLKHAYKFCFNPNRLIDAVMVLQQIVLTGVVVQEKSSMLFQEKMLALFHQLTTSECLDLYGYFANNDTNNLLYTLFNLSRGSTFDWLPLLSNQEKLAIVGVFDALQCVMDTLRIELEGRHFLTEPYRYDIANSNLEIDYRNRDAVFRVISLYKRMKAIPCSAIEQLFQSMEE